MVVLSGETIGEPRILGAVSGVAEPYMIMHCDRFPCESDKKWDIITQEWSGLKRLQKIGCSEENYK